MWTIFLKKKQKQPKNRCDLCGCIFDSRKTKFYCVDPYVMDGAIFRVEQAVIGLKSIAMCTDCFRQYNNLLESLKTEIEHKKIKESIKNERNNERA